MRAKPDMKPWVSIDKSKMSSVGVALKTRILGYLLWGCAAPTGLIYVFPINILDYFDALAYSNHSIVLTLDRRKVHTSNTPIQVKRIKVCHA